MKTLFVLACLSLCSCSGASLEPAPHINPVSSDWCPAACKAMSEKLVAKNGSVGCEEGKPVLDKNGKEVSCVDFCKYQHENGVGWNNDCIVNQAKTCEDIEGLCNPPRTP